MPRGALEGTWQGWDGGRGHERKQSPGQGCESPPTEDREGLSSSEILPASVLKRKEFSHQEKFSRLGLSYGPVTEYLG